MRFNNVTITEINETLHNERKYYDLNLRIGPNGDDIIRYSGNSGWQICKLSEITDMIKSLEDVKHMIERITGVEC